LSLQACTGLFASGGCNAAGLIFYKKNKTKTKIFHFFYKITLFLSKRHYIYNQQQFFAFNIYILVAGGVLLKPLAW
jgi:hypothetical protein